MKRNLLDLTQTFVDQIYDAIPRELPETDEIQRLKIVAHRGDHKSFFENTIKAIDSCAHRNIWGVEFDVRWTKDNVPILLHDPDTQRVFPRQSPNVISETPFEDLQKEFPQIPSLEQVIDRFSKRIHFMIELKTPLTPVQNKILKKILNSVSPVEDFHFLGLQLEILESIEEFPKKTILPVAELDILKWHYLTVKNGWGGLTGHYLLFGQPLIRKHHALDQKVGTGFIHSTNIMYREMQRGVDWIFTNEAVELAEWRNNALNQLKN